MYDIRHIDPAFHRFKGVAVMPEAIRPKALLIYKEVGRRSVLWTFEMGDFRNPLQRNAQKRTNPVFNDESCFHHRRYFRENIKAHVGRRDDFEVLWARKEGPHFVYGGWDKLVSLESVQHSRYNKLASEEVRVVPCGMRFLLYAPYVYALGLILLGFVASRKRGWGGYFWISLILAEVARLGLLLFLVQNFGQPVYLLEIKGVSVTLSYQGLYGVMGAALGGLLFGVGLYLRERQVFPGLWLLGLSLVQLLLAVILRFAM